MLSCRRTSRPSIWSPTTLDRLGQISFAAAPGPWLTTVEELRIWPINCHIPLLVRKNAAGVRRSGYPQALMDRPAAAVFRA